MKVEIATFRTIAKNWLFLPNISESTGSIFTKFSELVDYRPTVADDKSYVRFAIVQWTLL